MSATSKLGSLLRRLRKEKKMTQAQLSEASGVSRTQIARLETGEQGSGRPAWETMLGFAKAFGATAEAFAAMIDAETPTKSRGPQPKGRPKKDADAGTSAEPVPVKRKRKGCVMADLGAPTTYDEGDVRRRVEALGGGVILLLSLKDGTIRLRLPLKRFKPFKLKAAQDPVLRNFAFSHRKPKKGGA